MRIGVAYDLRADYLAAGFSEEDTAEFDSEITIDAICAALAGLGFTPVRIGNVKKLVEALARGERWDGVFNFCEGLKGVSREAQVPALLEVYDIPYVFSDPLTSALTLDKAMTKRVVRACGVPTADFALIEKIEDARKIELPFPLFLKPVAEGSGKGVNAKSKVDDRAALRKRCGGIAGALQPARTRRNIPAGARIHRRHHRHRRGRGSARRQRDQTGPEICRPWLWHREQGRLGRQGCDRACRRGIRESGGCGGAGGMARACAAATAGASISATMRAACRISSRSIRWPDCARTIPICVSSRGSRMFPMRN